MQSDPAGNTLEPSVHAYKRDAVDDFLAAASAERERLQVTIAEAEARGRRARAAVGIHRVMVSMLLETQRELAELRAGAEAEAADIVAAAEDEARAIVRAARHGSADRSRGDGERTIDLSAIAADEHRLSRPTGPEGVSVPPAVGIFDSGEDERFFAYLRGALADDQPLGPRLDWSA
jgi:cell division septum initiation protein DivIVA